MAAGGIARFIQGMEDRKERDRIRKAETLRQDRIRAAMGTDRHRQMILDSAKQKEKSRHNMAVEKAAINKNKVAAAKLAVEVVDMFQGNYQIMYKLLPPGSKETPQMLDTRRAIGLMSAEILGQGQSPKTSLDASTLTPFTKPDDVKAKMRQTFRQLDQLFNNDAIDSQAYSKAYLFAAENEGRLDPSLDIKAAPIDLTDTEFKALPDDVQDKVLQENLKKKLGFDVEVGRTKGIKFVPFTGGTRKVTVKKKDKADTVRFKVGSTHAGSDLGFTGDKAGKRFTVVENKSGKLKVKAAK